MYLKHKPTGDLVEIVDIHRLADPYQASVPARSHWGEELQDTAEMNKSELEFPSGESLPLCWVDPKYEHK